MIIRIPRIRTGVAKFDNWLDRVLQLVERANNVKPEPGGPLWFKEHGNGGTIGFRLPLWWSFAVSTGTIAGGTYGAPTTATVTLLRVVPGTPPTLTTTGGSNVTAYFPWPSTTGIGSGKLLFLVWFAGFWWIVGADCT